MVLLIPINNDIESLLGDIQVGSGTRRVRFSRSPEIIGYPTASFYFG